MPQRNPPVSTDVTRAIADLFGIERPSLPLERLNTDQGAMAVYAADHLASWERTRPVIWHGYLAAGVVAPGLDFSYVLPVSAWLTDVHAEGIGGPPAWLDRCIIEYSLPANSTGVHENAGAVPLGTTRHVIYATSNVVQLPRVGGPPGELTQIYLGRLPVFLPAGTDLHLIIRTNAASLGVTNLWAVGIEQLDPRGRAFPRNR